MTFLTPLALALSALAVPVVLLYILKLRRKEQVVPSTVLWQRALDDVQANAPWQRLRPNVLLLLQLLALAALVLALASPAYSRSQAFDGDLVVVVDQSYGMQARDVSPSRFAVALARAHDLAHGLSGGNVMSVIGMSDQPHLKIAESSDTGAIDHAIDTLQVGVAAPNWPRTLSLAASLARSGARTRVVLLTSRDSGIAGLPVQVPFPVQVIRIGGRLKDLGITAFQAKHSGAHTEALVRVSNFGASTARSDLDLFVNGQLADVRPLTLTAGSQQNLFWTLLPASTDRLEARLTKPDDVTVDKAAWAVLPAPGTRRVLLVSAGDLFLRTALLLDPTVRLTVESPHHYRPPHPGDFDLVAFDGAMPAVLPAAPALVVAPSRGTIGPMAFANARSVGPLVPAPGIPSPLLQYVDLSDVHVALSRPVRLPDWVLPIAVSGQSTLLAAGDNGSTRLVLFNFDLEQSDWPLRISFPVAVQNAMRYLAPGLNLGSTAVTAGHPLALLPAPGTSVLRIVRPDGRSDSIPPPFAPYTDTVQRGIYTAAAMRGNHAVATAEFAVDFFPARVAPAPGPQTIWLGHATGTSAAHRVSVPVSVAWALAGAGLIVLCLEWWFAFKR